MTKEKMILVLLILIFMGTAFNVYKNISYKSKLKKCNDIAIIFEKARHYPVDDLMVTNQDISSYMKNMTACLSN